MFRLTATFTRPARDVRPGDVVDLDRPYTVDEVTAVMAAGGTVLVRALGRFPGERRRRSHSWKADDDVAVIAPDDVIGLAWAELLDVADNATTGNVWVNEDQPDAIEVRTALGVLRLALDIPEDPTPPEPRELEREPF